MRPTRVIQVGVQPDEPGAASIEQIYREQLGRFRRVASAVLDDPLAAQDAVQDGSSAHSATVLRLGVTLRLRRGFGDA